MGRPAALATAATGAALLVFAPAPTSAVHTLAGAGAAADPFAPLLAAIALAAWSLLTWLLVVAAATAAAHLPGIAGRVGDAFARRVAPASVRRVVEVCLGLTVAVGALGAAPATAGTHPPPAPPAATAPLDWPAPPAATARPVLDWNPTDAPPRPADPVAAPVVVQAGDSLWAIAADHLPAAATDAQVARSWPAWWSANRAAVGPDPDLIHPGLRLTPPVQR